MSDIFAPHVAATGATNGELAQAANTSAPNITRALRTYSLHPGQLLRPAPATELQSLHPNHVWQIDASLCVLFSEPELDFAS